MIPTSACTHLGKGIIEKLQNITINNGYGEKMSFFWDKNNNDMVIIRYLTSVVQKERSNPKDQHTHIRGEMTEKPQNITIIRRSTTTGTGSATPADFSTSRTER